MPDIQLAPPSPHPHSPLPPRPSTTYPLRRLSKRTSVANLPVSRLAKGLGPEHKFLSPERRHEMVEWQISLERRNSKKKKKKKKNPQSLIEFDPPANCIRIHLPFDQSTVVLKVRGRSLRTALQQAFDRREIVHDVCIAVHADTGDPIHWDTDLSQINANRIRIYLASNLMNGPKYQHRLLERTLYYLTLCSVCNRVLMLQAMACQGCSFKCHKRCSNHSRARSRCLRSRGSERSPSHRTLTRSAQSTPKRGLTVPTNPNGSCLSPATEADWLIPSELITLGQCIGRGSFGTVYRAQYNGTVAAKKLNVSVPPSDEQLADFRNEVKMLASVTHTNVVAFLGAVTQPSLMIVTEWCDGNSLYYHLHVSESHFTMIQLMCISFQMSRGMEFLHSNDIIHRDLKSNNVFLQQRLKVKIGDFGLAMFKTTCKTVVCRQPNTEDTANTAEIAVAADIAVAAEIADAAEIPVAAAIAVAAEIANVAEIPVAPDIAVAAEIAEIADAANIVDAAEIADAANILDAAEIAVAEDPEEEVAARPETVRRICQPTGSILWMAPEVIRMAEPHSVKSDVYAFGIVLFEQLAEELPYATIGNRDQILYRVGRGTLQPDLRRINKPLAPSFRRLLIRCIEYEPANRPDFEFLTMALDRASRSVPRFNRSSSEPMMEIQEVDEEEVDEDGNGEEGAAAVVKTKARYRVDALGYEEDDESEEEQARISVSMEESQNWYLL